MHLELYDNAIDALNQLESFPRLTVLDISFNVIRDMSTVNHLPLLVELYIANNKIVELKGLENLTALKTLDAGANRIRTMDGLSGLTSIEHLWLGKNKITAISGISNLKNIRRLDVQSNRLTVVDNLEGQVDSLEELYLGSNGIDDEGIEQVRPAQDALFASEREGAMRSKRLRTHSKRCYERPGLKTRCSRASEMGLRMRSKRRMTG